MGINHLEELPKAEEVIIDPEEGQLFSERTERTRWELTNIFAHAGVASRRKAEELIKCACDGHCRELATIIKTGDQVEVEGTPIYNEEKVYYLFK